MHNSHVSALFSRSLSRSRSLALALSPHRLSFQDDTPRWRALSKTHGTKIAYHGTDAAALWSILNSGLRCFAGASEGGESESAGASASESESKQGSSDSSSLRRRRGVGSNTAQRYTSHGQMLGDGVYLGADLKVAAAFAKARKIPTTHLEEYRRDTDPRGWAMCKGSVGCGFPGIMEGREYAPVLECEIIDRPGNRPPPARAGAREAPEATYFVVKDPSEIRIRRVLFYERGTTPLSRLVKAIVPQWLFTHGQALFLMLICVVSLYQALKRAAEYYPIG